MAQRTRGGTLTQIMGRLVGPTVMTWQDDEGRYHAEVTTDEGRTRALAHARGAIKAKRQAARTWDWQQVVQDDDPRTTETTTYWVES